jgi:hypothetical protein
MLISFDYLLKAVRNHLCTGRDLYDIPSSKVRFAVDEGPGICIIVRVSSSDCLLFLRIMYEDGVSHCSVSILIGWKSSITSFLNCLRFRLWIRHILHSCWQGCIPS